MQTRQKKFLQHMTNSFYTVEAVLQTVMNYLCAFVRSYSEWSLDEPSDLQSLYTLKSNESS